MASHNNGSTWTSVRCSSALHRLPLQPQPVDLVTFLVINANCAFSDPEPVLNLSHSLYRPTCLQIIGVSVLAIRAARRKIAITWAASAATTSIRQGQATKLRHAVAFHFRTSTQ